MKPHHPRARSVQIHGLPSLGSLPAILSNIIAAKKTKLNLKPRENIKLYPQLPFNPHKLPFNPVIHDPIKKDDDIIKHGDNEFVASHRDTTPIDIPIHASEVFIENKNNVQLRTIAISTMKQEEVYHPSRKEF